MTAKKASNRGRATNIWLRTEDVQIIRDLFAFVASEGFRPSDSQIIKAALRVAKADRKFLTAFEDVLGSDGRIKRDD